MPAAIPRVVGLDLSLTSTGVVGVGEGHYFSTAVGSTAKKEATLTDRHLRLNRLTDQIMNLVDPGCALVVIESPAFSKITGHAHDRSGLWWMVINRLVFRGLRVLEVKPNLRAKYATGKGNAGKHEVVIAVTRRYPEWEFKTNDEADAMVLAAIGCRLLGHPLEDSLPQTHLESLKTLTLPEIPRA